MKLKVIQTKVDGNVVGESLHIDGKERLYISTNSEIDLSMVIDLMEHAFNAGVESEKNKSDLGHTTEPFTIDYSNEEYLL